MSSLMSHQTVCALHKRALFDSLVCRGAAVTLFEEGIFVKASVESGRRAALNQPLSALQIAGLPLHIIGQLQLVAVRGDDSAAKRYTKCYSGRFNDQNM